MTDQANNEKKPTFEQALAQLETIVTEIESGQVPLEASIAKYEQGQSLIASCRTILDAAEKKIQHLARQDDGTLAPNDES